MSKPDLVTSLVQHVVRRYQEEFGHLVLYGDFRWSEKEINDIKERASRWVIKRKVQGVSPTSSQGRALVRNFTNHWNFSSCRPVWLEEPPYMLQFMQLHAANVFTDRRKNVRAPNLNYRSELKRVIALALAQKPDAHDVEVCRLIDEQGVKCNWGRSFDAVFKDNTHRRKIEITISKVRGDMRKAGLLPAK